MKYLHYSARYAHVKKESGISASKSLKRDRYQKIEFEDFIEIVGVTIKVLVANKRLILKVPLRAAIRKRVFLVKGVRHEGVTTSLLLVSSKLLVQRLQCSDLPRRTLGQIIDSLPFQSKGISRVTVQALPDDEMPILLMERHGVIENGF